jgi:hypothetical protein
MEAWIAGLALGRSVIVAIVQFSGNRPVIDIEPDKRHREPNDWTFILRVRNGTPSSVQIRRHRFCFSRSKLIAHADIEDMAEQMTSGTVNFWMDADSRVDLSLIAKEKRWLILMLHWRRLSGLHLTSLLPLFVVMSPAGLCRLKRAQTRVQLMHAGRS